MRFGGTHWRQGPDSSLKIYGFSLCCLAQKLFHDTNCFFAVQRLRVKCTLCHTEAAVETSIFSEISRRLPFWISLIAEEMTRIITCSMMNQHNTTSILSNLTWLGKCRWEGKKHNMHTKPNLQPTNIAEWESANNQLRGKSLISHQSHPIL